MKIIPLFGLSSIPLGLDESSLQAECGNNTKQEIDIILQTKSGLLFNGKQAWNKKGNKAFDVTMGSWDGAEVCDLIGLYLLSQLSDMK